MTFKQFTKIKFLLVGAALFTMHSAFAQIGEQRDNFSLGFNTGINFNNATFQPKIKEKIMTGFTGGITARYISEKYFAMICGAQLELNFSQRGWNELFETTNEKGVTVKDNTHSYQRKMNYIDIPFLAHLAFGKEQGLQFFINAGPQVSFLLSEKETIKPDLKDWILTDTQMAIYNKKTENKFDYGITGGLGIELRTRKSGSFSLEGRYYFGLADFNKTTKKDYFSRAANSTISVKVAYLFDLKK